MLHQDEAVSQEGGHRSTQKRSKQNAQGDGEGRFQGDNNGASPGSGQSTLEQRGMLQERSPEWEMDLLGYVYGVSHQIEKDFKVLSQFGEDLVIGTQVLSEWEEEAISTSRKTKPNKKWFSILHGLAVNNIFEGVVR